MVMVAYFLTHGVYVNNKQTCNTNTVK